MSEGNLAIIEKPSKTQKVKLFNKMMDSKGEDRSFIEYCRSKLFKEQYWEGSKDIKQIPVDALTPHALHPRQHVNENALRNLTHTIIFHGIKVPLIVIKRPGKKTEYDIIDGKCRWLAAKKAKFPTVPAYIHKNISENEILTIFAVNDGLFQSYNPIEKGLLYLKLRRAMDMTQHELAVYIRVSQTTISQFEKLVASLPNNIIKDFTASEQAPVKPTCLLKLAALADDPCKQVKLYNKAKQEKWTITRLNTEINRCLNNNSSKSLLNVKGKVFRAKVMPISPVATEVQVCADLALLCLETLEKFKIPKDQQEEFFKRMARYIKDN